MPLATSLRDHMMCHSLHAKEWLKGVVVTTQHRYCPLHLLGFLYSMILFYDLFIVLFTLFSLYKPVHMP